MNAPHGVDTDSSSGEEDVSPPFSPVKPPDRPVFSFKALFLPSSKLQKDRKDAKDRKAASAPSSPTGEPQFTKSGVLRPPSPIQLRAPKKKVRIHVVGEDHPDSPASGKKSGGDSPLDLLASPADSGGVPSPMSVGDAGSPWGGAAMSPTTSPSTGRRDGHGPVAGEMFDLLRQLLVESTKSREGTATARLERIDTSSDDDPDTPITDQTHEGQAGTAKEEKMKKPSRLRKLASMTKLSGKNKTQSPVTASSQETLVDDSSSFSATQGIIAQTTENDGEGVDDLVEGPATNVKTREELTKPKEQVSQSVQENQPHSPIDPSNRLPDGKKAHDLAKDYYRGKAPSESTRKFDEATQSPAVFTVGLHPPPPPETAPPHVTYSHPHWPQPFPTDPHHQQHPTPQYQQYPVIPPGQPYSAPAFPNPPSSLAPYSPGTQPWPQLYPPPAPAYYPVYPHAFAPMYAVHPQQSYVQAPPSTAPPDIQAFPSHPVKPVEPRPISNAQGMPGARRSDETSRGQSHSRTCAAYHKADNIQASEPETQPRKDERGDDGLETPKAGRRPEVTEDRSEWDSKDRRDHESRDETSKIEVDRKVSKKPRSAEPESDTHEATTPSQRDNITEEDEKKTNLRAKLRQLSSQKDDLKKRLAGGSIDKAKGTAELERMRKMQSQIQRQLDTATTTNGASPDVHIGDAKPPSHETKGSAENSKDSPTANPSVSELKGQLEKVEIRRAELKKAVAGGKVDKEKGMQELERFTKQRDKLKAAVTSSDAIKATSQATHGPRNEEEQPASASSGSGEKGKRPQKAHPSPQSGEVPSPETLKAKIAETEKRMVEVKGKMLDKVMSRDEGEEALAKLDKSRKKLREILHEKESQDKDSTQQASVDPTHRPIEDITDEADSKSGRQRPHGVENESRGKEMPLADIETRMKKLKIKVKDGTISREEAEKEMRRLTKSREKLTSLGTVTHHPEDLADVTIPKTDVAIGDAEVGDKLSVVEQGTEVQKQLAAMEAKMRRLKEKVKEGSLGEEDAEKEMKRLARSRDKLLKPEGNSSKSGQETSRQDKGGKDVSAPPGAPQSKSMDAESSTKKLEMIERKMKDLKAKVKEGSMSKDEADGPMRQLAKSRLKLMAETEGSSNSKNDGRETNAGSELNKEDPKPSAEGRGDRETLEKQLEAVESRMRRLKVKVKEGSLDKVKAEKEMKQLAGMRGQLMGDLDCQRKSENQAKTDGQAEELDQEILARVLLEVPPEELGSKECLTRPRSISPLSRHHGSKVEPERAEKEREVKQNPRRDRAQGDHGPAKTPASTSGARVDDETSDRTSEDTLPPDPTSARVVSMHVPGSWSQKVIAPPSVTDGPGLRVDAAVPHTNEEVTWSKCLVSLAHCIDLGRDLSSKLLSRPREHDQPNRLNNNLLLVQILPRLITSLVMQRDIVSAMRGILGEEHSQAMGAFLEHILVVKRFLEAQSSKQKGRSSREAINSSDVESVEHIHDELSQAFRCGSLQAVIEYLLHLSDFLTPTIIFAVRDLMRDWRDDGLTISSVIRVVKTIRHELREASKEKARELEADQTKVEPSGVLNILDRILRFIEGDDAQKRRSIKYGDKPRDDRGKAETVRVQHNVNEQVASKSSPRIPPDREERRVKEEIQQSHRTKEKMRHVLHLDKDEKARYAAKPSHSAGARMARVDDGSDSSSLASVSTVHQQPRAIADSQLPGVVRDFLRQESPGSGTSPATVSPDVASRHHVQKSSVVRPPGPSAGAKGSHHHTVVDGEEDPDIGHRVPSRPRSNTIVSSKDSAYSQDSYEEPVDTDSEGTVESDDEARDLLAHADSGPQPVEDEDDEATPLDDERPSREQVKRAKKLMYP